MSAEPIDRLQRQVGELSVPFPSKRLRQLLSVALFLACWSLAVRVGFLGFDKFVGPETTLQTLVSALGGAPMTEGGETIYEHAAYSALRVLVAVTLAVLVAIPLGLAIGTSRRWEDALFPGLEVFRPVPPVAWVPIALLLLPTFRSGVIFVVFVGSFFPILVNTVEGVRTVEEEYVQAASSLGAESRQVFRHVIVPATLPSIVTGVSIGVGLAWITVVAAEMIAGGVGIGYIIFQAYRLLQTDVVAVGMIAIGALGYVSAAAVYRIGDYLTRWQEVE
ncbi:ABC transporter permease [Halopiger aswanensis]|uniref:NitT/TauT family transport system permease protein n=1 Tax=Halopiger aswanensis TaxID=148449 RepID=A0A419WDE8_9EURY|nr:ABC transporter permease [Halopiger aswanensis]RKD93336.1 NitT/TauT family transport system permease protein [Halopiger aswanensis]